MIHLDHFQFLKSAEDIDGLVNIYGETNSSRTYPMFYVPGVCSPARQIYL